MVDEKNTKQTNEMKDIREVKENKRQKEISKINIEQDIITAYVQLVFHTLKHSATEITPKSIRQEVKMFYEKFGDKEVKRLANIIIKEKKEKK